MKKFLLLAILIMSTSAFALPVAPFDALQVGPVKSKTLNASDYDFEGIVKLSNCSGALIKFNGMPSTAKAVVMTNGHCIQKPTGYLNAGEAWFNRPMARDMKLFDKSMNLFPIKTTKIIYATMTDTDLALYELDKTYAEIYKATNVRPLLLDTIRPSIGRPIEIISGYWDRGYSCEVDNFVFKVKEGQWTWTDSIRYTPGCDTIGGTSGSPLIAKGERVVVGINNTANDKGERCTVNNPCEVSANGDIHATQGVRYGQQTYNLYNCLTVDFQVDLTVNGCDLPK